MFMSSVRNLPAIPIKFPKRMQEKRYRKMHVVKNEYILYNQVMTNKSEKSKYL